MATLKQLVEYGNELLSVDNVNMILMTRLNRYVYMQWSSKDEGKNWDMAGYKVVDELTKEIKDKRRG